MNLIPWKRRREVSGAEPSPTTALAPLRQQMDSLFDRFFRAPWSAFEADAAWSGLMAVPRTDLADSPEALTVTMELPGVEPQDVSVQVTGDRLNVRAEKKTERQEKQRAGFYTERQYGTFQRTIPLPNTIDPEQVDASYKSGVLTIRLAKRPDLKPKKIKVRTA